MPLIIDTADNVTKKLSALKTAGVEYIIRYDCRMASGAWKQILPAEARAIAAAGLKLGIVYEDRGATASSFSDKTGYLSARYSLDQAIKRGQPAGSAIYFAVDFDATAADVRDRILPYFDGVYRAMMEDHGAVLRVGAYCSGAVAVALKAKHPDILIWITCSGGFRGTKAYLAAGKQDLWQNKCDTSLVGVDCDFSEARTSDWGWFVPGGKAVITDPEKPLHDVKWIQGIFTKSGFYHDDIDGDVGPKTVAAMIRYCEWHELG
jgi:hypothetical protein